jgi:iron complex transport system substrate-binding protein
VRKFLSMLMILMLFAAMAGCGAGHSGEGVRVIDSRGTEVVFDSTPKTIVSLSPANTEILYALGAEDRIIAVSNYCNYPEDTGNKQKLPTGEQLNIETLVSLDPDVIFFSKMDAMEDQVKQLEDAGIKVVVTEANSLDETYEIIRIIGEAAGKGKEAGELVEKMRESLATVKEEARGKSPKSVYVEVSPLQYGLWSCGRGTFVQELLDLIGARNIFEDTEGWCAVSEEQVIQRNPDIIVTTASPLTGIDDPVGDIAGRPNWAGISAVKHGHVYMLDGDMLSRPGPRLAEAARELLGLMDE